MKLLSGFKIQKYGEYQPDRSFPDFKEAENIDRPTMMKGLKTCLKIASQEVWKR